MSVALRHRNGLVAQNVFECEGEDAPDAEYRLEAATEQIKRIMKAGKSRRQLLTNESILY